MNRNVPWSRRAVLTAGLVTVFLAECATASVVFPVSGTSTSGSVSFAVTLTMAGNDLTIKLDNTSPRNTTDAVDVLTSFYFDILSGTSRPTLKYTGASGSLYLVRSGTTDLPYSYTPQTFTAGNGTASTLRAMNNGDEGWQFRTMNAASSPNLGFGIGTAGNTALSPNGFTPQIVGQGNTMINFGIYRGGDIDPTGLINNKYLVKNSATFTFTGVSGYTEADIVDKVVFGLGTSPDSTLTISLPEPKTYAILATAAAMVCGRAMRQHLFRKRQDQRWPALEASPLSARDSPVPADHGRAGDVTRSPHLNSGLTPSQFPDQCSREGWGTVAAVYRQGRSPDRRHTTRGRPA